MTMSEDREEQAETTGQEFCQLRHARKTRLFLLPLEFLSSVELLPLLVIFFLLSLERILILIDVSCSDTRILFLSISHALGWDLTFKTLTIKVVAFGSLHCF